MATRFINPVPQFVDNNGVPVANGTLTFYDTLTLNKKDTYSNAGLTIANANPLTLNSVGAATTEIWVGDDTLYRAILRYPSGTTAWDRDPLGGFGGSPTPPSQAGIISAEVQFGVVADSTPTVNGTDNATAIKNLIQFVAANPGSTVIWPQNPEQVVGFSGYLQFSHATNVHHVFGSPLRNIGNWNLGGATVVFGNSLFINHLAGVNTELGRLYGYRIASAPSGSISVTLSTPGDAANFHANGWCVIYGYDQQGNGFPPNVRYKEFRRIKSISGAVLTFYSPLSDSYYSTWYSYTDAIGVVGPATILPIDRGVNCVFCESMIVDNFNLLTNPADTIPAVTVDGNSAYNSSFVQTAGILKGKFTNLQCSGLFTGESSSVEMDLPKIIYVEMDKMSNKHTWNEGTITELLAAQGYDQVIVNGTTIKHQMALVPKLLTSHSVKFLSVLGGLDNPIAISKDHYQKIHTYEDNVFSFGLPVSIIQGGVTTESAPAPDQPGILSVTVSTAPTSTTFTVVFGDGSFRINAGLGTVLIRPSDMARFIIANIEYDGSKHLVTYVSAYQVAPSDILYYYSHRVMRLVGNVRLGANKRLPWLSAKRFADTYICEDDGIFSKTVDLTLKDIPPASATNNLYEIDGIVNEIEATVITPYTGGGDVRITISAYTPYGSTYTSTIASGVAGQRIILPVGSVNAQVGDTLTDLGYGLYIGQINVRPLAADNPGPSGWEGYIRVKATRR